MQSLHHLLTYVVHDIDHMLRYLLSIYLSSISIRVGSKWFGFGLSLGWV